MRNHTVTIPELSMIAGTRAMAGAGIALLLADWLTPEQRRTVGWTLAVVGGVMTIPLAIDVLLGHDGVAENSSNHPAVSRREVESAPRM